MWSFAILLLFIAEVSTDPTSTVNATLGQTAELVCKLSFFGNTPSIIWRDSKANILTVNLTRVTPDTRFSVKRPYQQYWNLEIRNVRLTDQGQYSCSLPEYEQARVLLNIKYPPTLVDVPSNQVTTIGGDISVRCSAQGFPQPVIIWRKFLADATAAEILRGSDVFSLSNVSRADAGDYRCDADNGEQPYASHTWTLDVRFPPELSAPYQVLSQKRGAQTLLQCLVAANPQPQWKWVKDGHEIQPSSKYVMRDLSLGEHEKMFGLSVYGLAAQDFGEYTCVVENEMSTAQATITLNEWRTDGLNMIQIPQDIILAPREDALFNCTLEGLGPEDIVSWWRYTSAGQRELIFSSHSRDGGEINLGQYKDKFIILGTYNLLIRQVETVDSGKYTCEVSSRQNYTAGLTIIEGMDCEGNSSVTEQSEAAFSCSLRYSGHDLPWQLEWFSGQHQLTSLHQDSYGLLVRDTSFPAQLQDAGVFVCKFIASQPPYSKQCSLELTVTEQEAATGTGALCRPSGPSSDIYIMFGVIIAAVAAIFICLIIVIVVHYRRLLHQTSYNSPRKRYTTNGAGSSVQDQELTALAGDREEQLS